MKSSLLIPRIALPLIFTLCAIPGAPSVFADEQVAFVWSEDNPISGEPNDPGYYLFQTWQDPDIGYSEYYFYTEGDFYMFWDEMYEEHSF